MKKKKEYGFIVVLEKKTPNKIAQRLMTTIFKNKYVKYIKAKMILNLNDTKDVIIKRKLKEKKIHAQ
jgi:hypothetical protein